MDNWTYDYEERENVGEAISSAIEAIHALPAGLFGDSIMRRALTFLELELSAMTMDISAEIERGRVEVESTARRYLNHIESVIDDTSSATTAIYADGAMEVLRAFVGDCCPSMVDETNKLSQRVMGERVKRGRVGA